MHNTSIEILVFLAITCAAWIGVFIGRCWGREDQTDLYDDAYDHGFTQGYSASRRDCAGDAGASETYPESPYARYLLGTYPKEDSRALDA